MITYENFIMIKKYAEEEGLTASQISKELNIDYRTVAKWMKKNQYSPRKSSIRTSKLDSFKDMITGLLDRHPYTATQIYQKIKEEGFNGGYSIVKSYVRKVRPKKVKPFLKLSFTPAECAQVDWGTYKTVNVGNTNRRLSFFVMVLCYSRMMYVEFTVLQTMEHFLSCHQNAFQFFGGVPQKIMVDNLKSAVLSRITGSDPVYNPRYIDFSNHYGFKIVACGVGKGNEKGRVENAVGYVKKNFLSGLDIPNFSTINPEVMNWLKTIANVRIHGETRKKPVELFKEEQGLLYSLPKYPYDVGTVSSARATNQFRITLDTNSYSVPAEYSGAALTLKKYPERLCVYDEEKLIARHIRSYERNRDFEDPDHPKELLNQRKKARDQKIFKRFLTLSPRALDYYNELAKRRMNPHHHIRKIVGLSEIYSAEKVARAMEDAFTFHAFSSEYIANILEQRNREWNEPSALHITRREDLLDLEIERPDISIYDSQLSK